MSGLVARGALYPVDGLEIVNWQDDPTIALSPEDGMRRSTPWVRMLILHTTLGLPGRPGDVAQYVIPGAGPAGKAAEVARRYRRDPAANGADLICGRAVGEVVQTADLVSIATYHARSVNPFSVGIEIVQEPDGGIYEQALKNAVILVIACCKILGIQLQYHWPYKPYRPVGRLVRGGRRCVGIFGHRDQTTQRYTGDPGDVIFEMLADAGAERFDYRLAEDVGAWQERQRALGLDDDGVPGPATVARLREEGYAHGLYALGKDPPDPALDVKSMVCRALGCHD